MSKEDMVGALSEAYDSLLIAADTAVTRGGPVEQGWGPREVLAHVTAWEAEATRRIPRLIAGAPSEEYDDDRFNAAAIAAIGDQTLGEVRNNLERAHAQLVTMLNGLDESAFAPGRAAHQWAAALTSHSQGHARELIGTDADAGA